jgi:NADH-quinone oxidoreductase subunit L
MTSLLLIILLSPLLGCVIAGFFGKTIGKSATHWTTIALMIVSFLVALWVFKLVVWDHVYYNQVIYTWGHVGKFDMNIGFLVDHMTAFMMLVVTFVSLMVHVYSIGYMEGC